MKAIRIIDGHPQLVNAPNPDGDGVQIKVVSSSICGSDLHMIDKGWLEGAILGHEFAGYTPEGKAVAIEPIFGCGGCRYCGDGYPAQCTKGPRFIGGAIDGGMAQYVEVPASTLVTLPSGFDIASASLVEPLAVAAHGIDQACLSGKQRVLVLGAGAIGLAVAAVLAGRGITFDIAARHPAQGEAAERLGGQLAVEDGYDVVLDAVGNSQSIADALHRVRPQGTVAMLGSFWDSVELPMSFCLKEVRLVGSMMYRCQAPGRSFDEAATLLHRHPHIARTLITHRFPLEGATEAFATARNRAAGAIKVVFDVSSP